MSMRSFGQGEMGASLFLLHVSFSSRAFFSNPANTDDTCLVSITKSCSAGSQIFHRMSKNSYTPKRSQFSPIFTSRFRNIIAQLTFYHDSQDLI